MAENSAARSGGPFVTKESAEFFAAGVLERDDLAAFVAASIGCRWPRTTCNTGVDPAPFATFLRAIADQLHPAGAVPQVEQVAAEILEAARGRWFHWQGREDSGWSQVDRVDIEYRTGSASYLLMFLSPDYHGRSIGAASSLAELREAALICATAMPTERPADPEPAPPTEPEAPAGEG